MPSPSPIRRKSTFKTTVKTVIQYTKPFADESHACCSKVSQSHYSDNENISRGVFMSTITKDGSQVIIKPGRDVVASMANEFRAELNAQIQESPSELVIDLAGVEMVDSVGIGVIIATHNSLDQKGGKLKVINIADDIYGLFSTMRLDRHFSVVKAG